MTTALAASFVVLAVVASVAPVGSAAASAETDLAPTVAHANVLDPALAAILTQVGPDQAVPVIVVLADQLDPGSVPLPRRGRRDVGIVGALKSRAESTQRGLRGLLERARAIGTVTRVTPLWVINAIAVAARREVILDLAARPEVTAVVADRSITAPDMTTTTASPAPESNVAIINAPALWALGYRGDGVTVASMDSGVDATHPDLAGGYRGGPGSWFDPYGQHSTPFDRTGHGTMTMGVMVGGGAGGSAIGVAPGATWIAAKIFNDAGVATSTAIHQSFQWLLDPDGDPSTADLPAFVSESWALGAPGCNLEFEPDLQALVAAGITPVFAAGNYGPAGGSSASPANNPSAFAVGAVDDTGAILSSSGRGPTSCGRTTAVTYPAVVAPGVDIVSSDLYGMYATSSGTSLAAPHVTGALVLLRQAFPAVLGSQLTSALSAATVDLGQAGADDTFGTGRIDVLAAHAVLMGPTPTPTPTSTPTPTPTSAPTVSPTATPTSVPDPTPTPTPAPPVDQAGPPAGIPVLAPNPANGSGAVAIAATIDDSATGGSAIDAAEWFVDLAGVPGSGRAMTGSFGAPTVTAVGTLTTGDLAGLAAGAHQAIVRGRDSAGNWGPTSTVALVVDRNGPAVTGASASPDPSQGSATARLAASISDASSPVVAAEWFIGTDPGSGAGTALTPKDGAFDSVNESVEAEIGLAGRPMEETLVSVRGRDQAGNWGPVSRVPLHVTPVDGIFADGFESGSTGRWSAATGSSRLSVTSAAAAAGQAGLMVTVQSGTLAYVTDTTPLAATGYHARFAFDGHGLVTSSKVVDIFTGLDRKGAVVLRVQYQRASTGLAQLRVGAKRTGGTTYSAWTPIPDGRHAIEVGWRAGRSAAVGVWIDGGVGPATGAIDTSAAVLESVRLGPSVGLTRTMSGTLSFDRFVSSAGSTIGP